MKNSILYPLLIFLLAECGQKPKQQEEKTISTPAFGISKTYYGLIGKDSVFQYTLFNKNGIEIKILNYGGTITHIMTPDKSGKTGDVILGYDSLGGYLQKGNPYFGCLVGRYANRIAKAGFTLDGKTYNLAANDGANTLHGGLKGFDKVIWDVKRIEVADDHLTLGLQYKSKNGEEGYPGNLTVNCAYQLTNNNELKMIYTGTTDTATPVNITNHCYFNLSGGSDPTILSHELMLKSTGFTPVDNSLIPTGKIEQTKKGATNEKMNFSVPKKVGKDIGKVKGGYDHNWVLDKKKDSLEMIASLYHAPSGRYMEVYTTQPGIQFYSGNFLNGTLSGKNGAKCFKHAGLCLETQHFPDSPNQPSFPNTILKPGETYRHETIYKFSIK